jgi:hypothetical protein
MDLGNTLISLDLAWQIGMTLIVIVSCYFSVRFGLNGAREAIKRVDRRTENMETDIKTLVQSDARQNERLGVMEANQRATEGWTRRVEERVAANTKVIERRLTPREG